MDILTTICVIHSVPQESLGKRSIYGAKIARFRFSIPF